MGFNWIKKTIVLAISACFISLSFVQPASAQLDLAALGTIIGILKSIDTKVTDVPTVLASLAAFISAWMDPDKTDTSTTLQGSFNQMGTLINAVNTPGTVLTTLNNDLLGNQGKNVFATNSGAQPTLNAITAKSFPNANDLNYTTMIGQPMIAKDVRTNVDSALNYILNASGSNIYHDIPTGGWTGPEASQIRYQALYNTLMAATSFNNYVLSNVYNDKGQFSALQQTLIQQSTDQANWFAKVGSENIGIVLRQLLMYQSQMFVLMTQMITLQRDMVSAQAMNTAVMIAGNQINENSMASFAQGKRPSP